MIKIHRYKGVSRRDAIATYKRLLEMLDECGCELVSDYTGGGYNITIKIKDKQHTMRANDFIYKSYPSFIKMKNKTASKGDVINGIIDKDSNGFIYDITTKSGTNIKTNAGGYAQFKDLKGQRFGRLTVVDFYTDTTINGKAFWLCKCDCNTNDELRVVNSSALQRGITNSCGCYKKEKHEQGINRKKTNAKNKLKQMLSRVNGFFIDDYIEAKVPINISIKGFTIKTSPERACSTIISLENFINQIEKEHDKVLSFVKYDDNKGFVLKIKTYDNGVVEFPATEYYKFINGRKRFYEKVNKNNDKCCSPYLNGRKAVYIEFNRDFCKHEPQKVLPVKYNQGRRCPICSQSKGEQVIQEYLSKENIVWQKQYKIITGDAVLDNKKYDLYLPTYNLIIEVHGFQHYEEVEFVKNQRNRSLLQEQENDKIKLEYALNNNYRYMVVSHREGDINKTIARFKKQFKKFLEYYNSGKVNETKNKNRIY